MYRYFHNRNCILFAIAFLLIPEVVCSQTKDTSTFNQFVRKNDSTFKQFVRKNDYTFKQFVKKNDSAFNRFKELVENSWGKNNFASSDSISWVAYYNQHQTRSIVNFKNNTAEIDILLKPVEAANKKLVLARAEKGIEELSENRGKTIDYNTPYEKPAPISNEPLLEGQLITKEGKPVNSANVKEFSNQVLKSTKLKKTNVIGTDGISRIKLSLTIPLSPNSIKIRAKEVLPIVQKYSRLYKLEPALLLAIIHVESYFNPKAISRCGAIGLMQLVPSSGGMEAYEKIFSKNQIPTQKFLLNPDNNINLGATYIRILLNRYFNDVHNVVTKRYCCIASYNTGPGNLSCAYTGSSNLVNAIYKINKKTPKQNFEYITTHLKYKEARNYLRKVNNKYVFYKNWLKKQQ